MTSEPPTPPEEGPPQGPPTPPQPPPGGWRPPPREPVPGASQPSPPSPSGLPSAPSYAPGPAFGAVAATDFAGFWRRLVAYILDAIVVGVISGVITAILRVPANDFAGLSARSGLISLIVGVLYFGYLWSRNGQSLGYMALGMRLIRTSATPVSFGVAVVRYILIYLSFALCLIPAIISAFMIALGNQKQAIHDAIVGTLVVRVP